VCGCAREMRVCVVEWGDEFNARCNVYEVCVCVCMCLKGTMMITHILNETRCVCAGVRVRGVCVWMRVKV
jgi:hypothetical protein